MRDELDRILSSEADIVPSSGFANAVMDAVRAEASTPPPIPFPWKRALPGLLCGLALLAALIVNGLRSAPPPVQTPVAPILTKLLSVVAPVLNGARFGVAGWIALALFLAFASVKLSMRLTRGRL